MVDSTKLRNESINRAANCSCATHEGRILISGGVRGAVLKRTAIHNLRENKIRKSDAMNTARSAHASAFFADTYFVAGGHSSSNGILNSVEKYEWLFFKCVSIFNSDCFFHRHDSSKNGWKFVAPMKNARCLFSLAVAHGFLYAIGGQDQRESLRLVERYDPDADTWERVSSLNIPRSSAAVAVHCNHIYVIGGATKINSDETATVERFDGNTWTTVMTT